MKLAIKVNGKTQFYTAENMDHEAARDTVKAHVLITDTSPGVPVMGACLALVVDNTQPQERAA